MLESIEAVVNAFRKSLSGASEYLAAIFSDFARAPSRLTLRGAEVFSMSRAMMLRSLLLSRYHHRSHLSVYLRLLDVPVPVIYGRKCGRESVSVTGS